MDLPFSVEQFIDVFRQYNLSVWPMQMVAYVAGGAAVVFCVRKKGFSDRFNALVLSSFWLWMGIAYHWIYFSPINKAAYGFGVLFVIQGLIFLFSGIVRRSLSFGFKPGVFSIAGIAFILYAMLLYPVIGILSGHGYPDSPCFGVAPCPSTIFTFGLLLLTDRKVPKYVLVIPLLWSFIGFTAALKLGVREDIGLIVAGVGGTALLIVRDRYGDNA